MTRRKTVMFADELDGQDSPVLAAMEYYEADLDRNEYVLTCYLGEIASDEVIPSDVQVTFPAQFRRRTLLETPPASDEVQ